MPSGSTSPDQSKPSSDTRSETAHVLRGRGPRPCRQAGEGLVVGSYQARPIDTRVHSSGPPHVSPLSSPKPNSERPSSTPNRKLVHARPSRRECATRTLAAGSCQAGTCSPGRTAVRRSRSHPLRTLDQLVTASEARALVVSSLQQARTIPRTAPHGVSFAFCLWIFHGNISEPTRDGISLKLASEEVRQSGRKDAPCAGTPWNSSGRSSSC